MSTIRTYVKKITPEYAAILMQHNNLNRPINRITLEDYKSQIQKGLWKLNGEPIIISNDGVLLNGQHRLTAVIETGLPITSVVVEGVENNDFATIDTGRTRTIADIFNIEEIPNANSVGAIITAFFRLNKVDSSSSSKDNLRRLKMSKPELLDFYRKNSSVLQSVYKFAARCHGKLGLMKTTEVGALYLYLTRTLNHSEGKVQAFFEQLFEMTTVTNNTIKILHDTLIKGMLGKIVLTPSLRNAYIVKTWNSYIKGKELKVLNYNKDREGFLHFL